MPRAWGSAHEEVEAQRALLAALITQRGAVARVRRILAPTHFTRGTHRAIYRACLAVADRGGPIDATEVCVALLGKPEAIAELAVDIDIDRAAPARGLIALARRIARGGKRPGYLTANQIERVRARTDAVAVVSETVPLTRRGHGFVGRCPFHRGGARLKTVSTFHLSPRTGFWHCSHCEACGDPFLFVTRVQRCSFSEAVRRLARREGVTLHARP